MEESMKDPKEFAEHWHHIEGAGFLQKSEGQKAYEREIFTTLIHYESRGVARFVAWLERWILVPLVLAGFLILMLLERLGKGDSELLLVSVSGLAVILLTYVGVRASIDGHKEARKSRALWAALQLAMAGANKLRQELEGSDVQE